MDTKYGTIAIIGGKGDRKVTKMCEKPTPLGVGWIAQR